MEQNPRKRVRERQPFGSEVNESWSQAHETSGLVRLIRSFEQGLKQIQRRYIHEVVNVTLPSICHPYRIYRRFSSWCGMTTSKIVG